MTPTEATAPARIDLAGGLLDRLPPALLPTGAIAVGVAIDRRAFCRVEPTDGVRLESKDTLTRAEGPDVASVLGPGSLQLVAHVLHALGVETGVRVAVQARVPADAGLGASTATAVAVAAASARALGRDLDAGSLAGLVRQAESQVRGRAVGPMGPWMALQGGVMEIQLEPPGRAVPLATDPGRVEESLLLVDMGGARPAGVEEGALERLGAGDREAIASAAAALRDALVSHRYEQVPGLIDRDWEARKRLGPGMTSPEIDRIVEAARSFGGAAWACGPEGGGMAAVWCAPGQRPALEQALGAAGFRPVGIRLDLRGLEVE
jgi:galactokinase/mevalonate kinase-like predicted kinase